jgi:hypothetical protein
MVSGEIKMIFMIRFFFILIFLSACNAFPLYTFTAVAAKNSILGYEDIEITNDTLVNIPYAFIRAKIGKGPGVIMVLAKEDKGVMQWISADNVNLFTYHGKIIRTLGLANDIEIINYIKAPELSDQIVNSNEVSYLANFMNPALYEFNILTQLEPMGTMQTLQTIYGKKNVLVYKEVFEVKSLGWKGKNTYFISEGGALEQTTQEIHPFLPPIKIEFIRKYQKS